VYLLYSLATLLAAVLLSPFFIVQGLRKNKYVDSAGQRLGLLPDDFNAGEHDSIWLQAVSVGEVLAARPVIRELKQRYPSLRIFLSTTTRTGQELARRTVTEADGVFYFPFDWMFAVRRTLNRVRPKLFVMVETELWPNLLRECRRRGIRTLLINGRVSPRSARRYALIQPLFRRVLADVEHFCVQGEDTQRRLVELGADPARITMTGSLKFDALEAIVARSIAAHGVLRCFRMPPSRQVFVAGSTTKGEEEAVVRAFLRVRSAQSGAEALLVLAPRHPDRVAEAEAICRHEQLATIRRSELPVDEEPDADVVVLDTIGELAQLYQIATVAFVGGSLVPVGGHNILEPAVHGKPIVFGPFMHNFAEIAEAFLSNTAAVQVRDSRELEEVVVSLMQDPVRRARLGAAARALVDASRGAKEKTLVVINELLPRQDRRAVVRPFRVVH
jgi:3-deoxy-D-manno-octulosonic-acid transferase